MGVLTAFSFFQRSRIDWHISNCFWKNQHALNESTSLDRKLQN
jgi:hypothetical protein